MSLSDQTLQFFPVSARVSVLRARGLRIKGKDGTNDAYTALQAGRETFRTPVAEKHAEPVWGGDDATFIFTLPAESARANQDGVPVLVRVLHRVPLGVDKLLGLAVVNVHEIRQDGARENPQWFKLLNKAGKADKERGEVLLDIQFLKSSMSVSMIDLSDKSHSRLGKFKDKLRGKKKDGLSDSASAILPSVNQVLTDSEGEMDGETEGESRKKKKNKLKSLFVPKSNMKRNSMSQSMSSLGTLPDKNSSISSSTSSGLNVESSEGKKKKKFPFLTHKRNSSTDSKASNHSDLTLGSTNQNPPSQIDICINGSHVYREETQSEEVQEMEEEEEEEEDKEEEEERWRREDEERERLEEERRREAEEERKRKEKEKQSRMEEEEKERIRKEREKEEHRRRIEEEEKKRIRVEREKEEQRRVEEEEKERIRLEREKEEQKRRMDEVEKERIRMEREIEEQRRIEEEDKERIRIEREKEEQKRRMHEEEKERIRMEKEKEEQRRKMVAEKERIRIEREKEEDESIRKEEKEKERIKMEREIEEQRRRIEEEEKERIRIEKEKEEQKRMMDEDEKERIRLEREKEEQRRRMEEEEKESRRIEKEEQRRKLEEEERMRVKREKEEQMRKLEEERRRKEESEAEELRRKMQEKAEEEQKVRIAEEEKMKEEKKRAEKERMMEEKEKKKEEKRIEMERRLADEKTAREEEERRIAEEKEKQRKEQERVREEKERKRVEMKRKEEEQERRNMEIEEKKKKEKQMREEQESNLFEESVISQSTDFTRSARISNVKPSMSISATVSQPTVVNTNPFLDDDLDTSISENFSVEETTAKKGRAPLPPQSAGPDVFSRSVPKPHSHLKDVSKRPAPQPPGVLKMTREVTAKENTDQAGLGQGAKKTPERHHESKVSSVFQVDTQIDTNPFTCEGALAINDLTDDPSRREEHLEDIVEPDFAKPNAPSCIDMDLRLEPLVCKTDGLPSMERFQKKSRAPLPPTKPKRTGDQNTPHQQACFSSKTNLEQAQENYSNKKDQGNASVSSAEIPAVSTPSSTVSSSTVSPHAEKSQVMKPCTTESVETGSGSGSRTLSWAKVVPNDAGEVRGQVAPTSVIRQHAVKPLSAAENQPENYESRVPNNTQPNTKAAEGGTKGPYSQLTQPELISLALRQQEQISQRDARILELEQYIDSLLVRVMEEKPSILMTLNTKNKSM